MTERGGGISQSSNAPTSREQTHDGVTLLKQLVHEDERLERLHLVRQDGLGAQSVPHRQRRVVVPSVDNALWSLASRFANSASAAEMRSAHRHRGLGLRPLTSNVLLLCRGSACVFGPRSWTYWVQSPPDS